MFLRNRAMAWATIVTIATLSACGPVKFSSSSDSKVDTAGSPSPSPSPSPTGSPTPTPSPTGTPTLRTVHYRDTIAPANYKLDLVLVIDDSNSMLSDNQKLASRLSGLITKLNSSNIDWQMCATVTRAIPITSTTQAWGASIYWQPAARSSALAPDTSLGMVLRRGTANTANIFTYTINYIGAGWAGSDDERGIKAAYRHVYNGDYRYNPNNGCYRTDSAVAYIVISDEDERSIGGDASQQVYSGELKALENEDSPQYFIDFFKDTFGSNRRFTVNSIIVKPGDSTCKAAQDAEGSKSHYGFKYSELSNLTGGGVGSICAADFTTNMDLFFGKITSSLSSVPLECVPYGGVATVTLTPNATGITSSVQGASVVFSQAVSEGTTIDITYKCQDRSPSSTGQPTILEAPGFFTKIISFFKNLF